MATFADLPFLTNSEKERLRDMRFYQQQRISEEFLDRYFREDRRTLWYPHKNELMAAGFITQR